MAYLDQLIGRASDGAAFPWALAELERPELTEVARTLVEHGLLATAAARELQARGWLEDDALVAPLAAAIHRRLVNRRRSVGPYAPLVTEQVGPCDPDAQEGARRLAGHLAAEAAKTAATATGPTDASRCAACSVQAADGAPFSVHLEPGGRPVPLCLPCHRLAHMRTPPLAAVEVQWLSARERAAAPQPAAAPPGS
jgi:hypothetical protein